MGIFHGTPRGGVKDAKGGAGSIITTPHGPWVEEPATAGVVVAYGPAAATTLGHGHRGYKIII